VPLLEQVLEKNPETVKLVFKNMPLRFHQFADPAARAALAAAKQDKFWEFHDELFNAEKLSNELITNTAVKLGLDMARFNSDMNSAEVKQEIAKDLSDAQQAGVTGTPTIFINGKKLKNRSLQGFQDAINSELSGK
jgi:protein-disulfide isomerase